MEDNNEDVLEVALQEEVKRYLDITWNDNETNKSVKEYISRAKQDLSELISPDIDYEEDITARGLLKDHCRYERNKELEYFEHNFLSTIQRLQLIYACKEIGKNEE